MLLTPFNIFSAPQVRRPVRPERRTHTTPQPVTVAPDSAAADALPDTILLNAPVNVPAAVVEDQITTTDSAAIITPVDTVPIVDSPELELFDPSTIADSLPDQSRRVFIPDPTRAVWLSALCPGLGQIYNRRYWKLPIVVGAFMGLGYGASWNNTMLADYTRAYYDLMDNDPSTNSYMDFFPPTTDESSLNRKWLEQTLKRRKDYFRRNRDLCIIGMVGMYLLSIVDAYVDASLTNFDISPDLAMRISPTILRDNLSSRPSIGLYWAFTF